MTRQSLLVVTPRHGRWCGVSRLEKRTGVGVCVGVGVGVGVGVCVGVFSLAITGFVNFGFDFVLVYSCTFDTFFSL